MDGAFDLGCEDTWNIQFQTISIHARYLFFLIVIRAFQGLRSSVRLTVWW